MRNEKAMNVEGMQNGRAKADQNISSGKIQEGEAGAHSIKKCREAHPSKKTMDIPTFQVILPQRKF